MKKTSAPLPEQTKRPTLGVLLDNLSLSWSWKVWRGMVAGAQAHDANLICFLGSWLDAPDAARRQENVIYKLASSEILDGLALHHGGMGTYLSISDFSKFLQQYQSLPMVSIEDGPPDMPTVSWDAFEGMHKVMDHLIEVHGCRRIVFLGGYKNNPSHQERYRAYVETLKEYDIPLDPRLIFEEGWSQHIAQDVLDQRKLQPKIDFDAVTAYNDAELLRVLAELQARGFHVPGDVALVGFDDNLESQLGTLPLTSLRPPNIEVSQMAAELLLAILDGQPAPERTILPTKLMIRQSCGCISPAVIQAGTSIYDANPNQIVVDMPTNSLAQPRDVWSQSSYKEVALEMAQALGDATTASQMATLLDSFFTDLISAIEQPKQVSGHFIAVVSDMLTQTIIKKQKVSDWQNVISILQKHSLPLLAGKTQFLLIAQVMWQQARILIGEAIERTKGAEKLETEQYADALRQVGEALITTFDVDGLMNVLAHQLPRLGFTQCYLSLYDNPQAPMEGARLILAYNEN